MAIIDKNELEEVIAELKTYKGRQTELITVYVPAGYDVNAVQRQLEAEKSTAKNIKSTATRKNVTEALEKIVRHLKEFKQTPEHGLAIFAGNISQVEGQDDLRLWSIEPPEHVCVRLYRCDKEFVLDPLEEMADVDEVFGLLVMDRKEATVGKLVGKRIEVVQKMSSGIPSKVRAGGQCLFLDSVIETEKGFKRIEDVEIGDQLKSVNKDFTEMTYTKCLNKWNKEKENYIIIILNGGASITSSLDHTFFKEGKGNEILEVSAKDLTKKDSLITIYRDEIRPIEIKDILKVNKKINLIDIETESKNFFANGVLVHNSSQRFHRITEGLTKEFYKRIADEMKKAFAEDRKLKAIIVGGPVPTKDEFLDNEYLSTPLQKKVLGRVDIGDTDESGLHELVDKSQELLAGQEIIAEKQLLEKFFNTLGKTPELASYRLENVKKALGRGAVDLLILSKDTDKTIMKELKTMAINIGSKIELVSLETEEGEQFKNLSGIGAILRFRIE